MFIVIHLCNSSRCFIQRHCLNYQGSRGPQKHVISHPQSVWHGMKQPWLPVWAT